jgi:hypothetical protein
MDQTCPGKIQSNKRIQSKERKKKEKDRKHLLLSVQNTEQRIKDIERPK